MRPSKMGVHFYNSFPGRYPGETGILTTTDLRFRDPGEHVARIARKLELTKSRRETALDKALASRGFLGQLRLLLVSYRATQATNLELRLKHAILRACSRPSLDEIGLEVSNSGSPFHEVTFAGEANRILKRLVDGMHVHAYVPKNECAAVS